MSSSPAFAPDHHHLSPLRAALLRPLRLQHRPRGIAHPIRRNHSVCHRSRNLVSAGVSVPCTSLFKTVTVRCGHCTNLLSVNMRGLPAANQLHLEEFRRSPSNTLINQPNSNESTVPVRGIDELPKPPAANRRER